MRHGSSGEPFFTCDVAVSWDAVNVPTVVWRRAGFYEWTKRVAKHKPKGRRRASRDGIRATIGGVR